MPCRRRRPLRCARRLDRSVERKRYHLLRYPSPEREGAPDVDELEADPALKPFADVWYQLVVENALLKHCNVRAISTRIVVPAALREEVFRALHGDPHHGYEATLRSIAQRF